MKTVVFEVEGQGDLPADMLRYDSCWPADQEAAQSLILGRWASDETTFKWTTELRRVRLLTDRDNVTPARWQSFGWKVVSQKKVR